ncbi:putative receptor-like protein kinase [Dichanthelium oligosanthes]|uniref:Salt tolerance receptor-like cytoplasmic kinase 1 n=1 Tax=Dichanthelium oligosanthes TaxID=888268 RepID=A0A1E5VUT9_9POAL|nr:putative receptor-like protein kinase [Dichanthelium oligosanthes]
MLHGGCGLLWCLRGDKGEAAGRADPRVADEPAGGASVSSVGKGGSGAARRFAWAEIESVTAGFSSRVIGQGGFSTVYLACLSSSRLGAVKVQRSSSERLHRAFRQELDVLLSLRHPHVVRLLGYCDEREEGVLVFEYAPNGDLHERLHGSSGKAALPWARRMAIAFQVAMALEHLHVTRDPAVIHGDIKASNVLLDAGLDAKLCDFGNAHVGFSAALQPPPEAAAPCRAPARPVMGSPGYVDPHFLRSGVATKKSDVYSYGVLLLELLTGREAICADTGRRLTAAVGPTLSEGEVADVVDRMLGDDYDAHEAATVAALALRCVSDGPGLRPSMAEVVRELQEKTTALISAAGAKPAGKMVS